MNDKELIVMDQTTGKLFKMNKEDYNNAVNEVKNLLKNGLIKEAKIGTYWDFIEEFINPMLPDDQKFIKGQSWKVTPDTNDLPDIDWDDPFGVIAKF